MSPTKLLYMEDMQTLTCEAYVEKVDTQNGKSVVYLDQTVFYPQGGGQPYDTGTMTAGTITFTIEEVRFVDGEVLHIGHFEGTPFMVGEGVTCTVDGERRALNARLHSGGHVVDMAVNELGYSDWTPGKGFHFPEGPYVEYAGSLGNETGEEVGAKIEQKMNEIIGRGITTEIRFVSKEEMATLCRHVPENLPEGKPARVVLYGDFGVPCGGTHVAALKDIGHETVRKVKEKAGVIRVSYAVE